MTAKPPEIAPVSRIPPGAVQRPASQVPAVDLSAQINAAYDQARAMAGLAKNHARHAIVTALECGRLLQRQKTALPHGEWQAWLAENCPAISAATARRYMRLAKRSSVTVLEDAESLRQAYLATGVLPEPAPDENREPSATTPTVTFVRGLDQFRRWFNRRTEQLPLERWTPEARRLLRNELAWFRKLHDQLSS